MKKVLRKLSMVLTLVMVLLAFVVPAAAGQENGAGRRNVAEPETQYLDAEVRVIDGQPVLIFEKDKGNVTHEFPWPETAIVDGKEVALQRQGDYFLLPTADGVEEVSIEDFDVAMVAGQIVLMASVNPWWTIPVAVATAALKAAGVAITTATLKAATILIAAGKKVTVRTVHVVVSSWPIIEAALRRAGRAVGWWAVGGASFSWVQGNCILCGQRTPDGHFGDVFSSGCAQRFGQFFGLRP